MAAGADPLVPPGDTPVDAGTAQDDACQAGPREAPVVLDRVAGGAGQHSMLPPAWEQGGGIDGTDLCPYCSQPVSEETRRHHHGQYCIEHRRAASWLGRSSVRPTPGSQLP